MTQRTKIITVVIKITAAIFLVFGHSAMAKDLPPLEYFDGKYKAIGRLANEVVVGEITIIAKRGRLDLQSTGLGSGWLGSNKNLHEGASQLTGKLNDQSILCLFQNDPDNYPRITCKVEPKTLKAAEGLLTLWPQK